MSGRTVCMLAETLTRNRVSRERTVRAMKVPTVYAHPNPASFCHAVLEQFTQGLADAWREGDLSGRIPLLRHKKALIMTPTFFRESDYRESGCGEAIERLVDDFGFRYPGIETVEHVYFHAVGAVGEVTRAEYLQQAYRLGHEFESGLTTEKNREPKEAVKPVGNRS